MNTAIKQKSEKTKNQVKKDKRGKRERERERERFTPKSVRWECSHKHTPCDTYLTGSAAFLMKSQGGILVLELCLVQFGLFFRTGLPCVEPVQGHIEEGEYKCKNEKQTREVCDEDEERLTMNGTGTKDQRPVDGNENVRHENNAERCTYVLRTLTALPRLLHLLAPFCLFCPSCHTTNQTMPV